MAQRPAPLLDLPPRVHALVMALLASRPSIRPAIPVEGAGER